MSEMVIPGPLDGTFSYLSRQGVYYSAFLEVQVDVDGYEDGVDAPHTWHIFIHSTSPPDAADQRYYRVPSVPLYDAISTAFFEFDLYSGTSYVSECLLRGDWIEGARLKADNKRAWFQRMFDRRTLDNLFRDLSEDERTYINEFVT